MDVRPVKRRRIDSESKSEWPPDWLRERVTAPPVMQLVREFAKRACDPLSHGGLDCAHTFVFPSQVYPGERVDCQY